MKAPWLRALAFTALVGVGATTTTTGCGYILHPERRGNSNAGPIDGGVLVMDLLWLIPGILPGVVFLIVDFTSGTMYVSGRMAMNTTPGGQLHVALDDQPRAATIDLRVVTGKTHRVLADRIVAVGPTHHAQSVDLAIGDAARRAGEPAFLVVADANNRTRVLQAPIEIP